MFDKRDKNLSERQTKFINRMLEDGTDYFAIRGGINPYELTLMSFGKFTDDTSSNTGRLTIFIGRVTDIGTFYIDGINSNYTILSILNGNN